MAALKQGCRGGLGVWVFRVYREVYDAMGVIREGTIHGTIFTNEVVCAPKIVVGG